MFPETFFFVHQFIRLLEHLVDRNGIFWVIAGNPDADGKRIGVKLGFAGGFHQMFSQQEKSGEDKMVVSNIWE